ncbi:trigger factor [Candidatus Phycosocius spiralis]|uniref:Trigger factor n=1 Tax=Candidatus Phycosocius spiralis TaxID=2815099 RepID=A0ABQ4PTE5_9PROT|nr:trigger factor [Candidatus Phycosocius spiralis]GIU66174.1 trigger factor [Candidatus Phycosocius spiralis]
MQIVEKSAQGLCRVYGVTFPATMIASRTDAKIAELAPQLNIKGFRKGKVPIVHVKRMYGKSILSDVLNELVQEGVESSITNQGVRAASKPDVKNLGNLAEVMDGKADLSFDVELDIMPDFTPVDIQSLSITRPVAEATEAEIEEALAEIAKQAKSFEAKKGKATHGDAVVCNFVGKLNGVEFDGGKAEGATVILGSNSYIPGFEDQLIGVKAEDEKVLNVTFPTDYGVATLAGKAVTFDVTVTEVKKPVDSKIDDALAQSIGLSDLATLKEAVKKNIHDQFAQLSRQKAKRSLLDALDNTHSFDLPPKMLAAEFEAIWAQVAEDKAAGNEDPEDAGKSEDELKAEYTRIAERRVRLGLVLAEVGRINGVEVKDEEVARAVQAEAARFPGQERQVYEFFQKNPNAVASLRAPLYEEKVVDFVLQMAKVNDVKVSRAELESEDETPLVNQVKATQKASHKAPAKVKKIAPHVETAHKRGKNDTSASKPKDVSKPTENKPAVSKPAVKKPALSKPAVSKPAVNKTEPAKKKAN